MNNENKKIIGYDPNTGQPMYENIVGQVSHKPQNQQFINNNQPQVSNQQVNLNVNQQSIAQPIQNNNTASEKLKKYRRILHNDSLVLLIVSIIAIIVGIIFISYEGAGLFLRSLLYFLFLIVLVFNKNVTTKFIGTLSIIVSAFMIIFAIFNHSLFDIVYFLLGIFCIIHSVKYLKQFKNTIYQNEIVEKSKLDKLKYISLILLIMCFAYPVVSIFIGILIDKNLFPLPVVLICSLTSLILNVFLLVNKRKSALIYICLVFSILITFLSGILFLG